MITVKLKGGLGNQLFQYALGRNLSLINETNLILDISNFASDKLRNYALGSFNIPNTVTLSNKSNLKNKFLYALGKKNLPLSRILKLQINFINEYKFEFNDNILQSPNNSFLDGYWQSEKYFNSIEHTIRNDLLLNHEFSEAHKNLLNEILNTNSVSIHVRRGDYANNPTTKAYHGLCPIDWYVQAINKIKETEGNTHFFIFSDDVDWVKSNLKSTERITYVSNGACGSDSDEMTLMSRCKHNIIANSSFSWWAAWLNNNPAKIVIAPSRWFSAKDINTNDLIPETWIRL